ncbi:MAG: hypothetical protein AB1757_11020 [Acidobacteriota bacterium]
MKKGIRKFIPMLLSFSFVISSNAQEIMKRQAGESLEAFAKRIIPAKTELVHTVVEGKFGAFAKAVVILFDKTDELSAGFSGWVLALNADGSYKKFSLPAINAIPGQFEFSVNAVMFANADKDPQFELILLFEQYRNGSGEEPFKGSLVYDWDGKQFVSMTDVETHLEGLTTAKAVRAKLKALGY